MAAGSHIENRLFRYISTIYCPINAKFFLRRSMITLDTGYLTKMPNFENSRWRTAPILKMVLSLYLSRESSVFDKIWYADADPRSKNSHMTKYQNFANSKWQTVAILKVVFGYISTIYCPIDAIFGMRKYNNVQTRSHDQNTTKFRKFTMSDGRHFENGFIAISQLKTIHFE